MWLAALRLTVEMAKILEDSENEKKYSEILDKGKAAFEKKLWNGKFSSLFWFLFWKILTYIIYIIDSSIIRVSQKFCNCLLRTSLRHKYHMTKPIQILEGTCCS